jgi:pyruvate dehydrogenase complex dehydrogenase (E1) component
MRILERAGQKQVDFPATVSSPYVNTIPTDEEPDFPGDEYLERRIRAFIRWNAAVMVVRANSRSESIGGHLSTYASSASLYEVGFNHFFRGKDDGARRPGLLPGPRLPGHLRPRLRRGSALRGASWTTSGSRWPGAGCPPIPTPG